MPYIKKEKRLGLREAADNLNGWICDAGDFNYAISCLVHFYFRDNPGNPNYDIFNEVIGVLECVKLELYRDVIGPYEQKKKEENGAIP